MGEKGKKVLEGSEYRSDTNKNFCDKEIKNLLNDRVMRLFFCPYKTAGKSICEHFNISNIHTLVKDIYHPNLKIL